MAPPRVYARMGCRVVLLIGACLCAFGQTDRHDGERKAYDDIYTNRRELFRAEPNAFLMRAVGGRKPGRALDVAMGQGRNALWLASQGWEVTGFDLSPEGIAEARREAAKRGLKIDGRVAPYETFDWGVAQWDLIVFSYFFPREALPKVWTALRPGGLVVVETFHLDTAKVRPTGGGFRNNEAFEVFRDYRVLVYEDVEDRQDWGLPYGATNRLVRVLAQKAAPLAPGCSWEGHRYGQGESMCWGVTRWSCGTEGWTPAGRCAADGAK